jgi:hypothetical protein
MPWVSQTDVYKHIVEANKCNKCKNLTPNKLDEMLRSYNRRIKVQDDPEDPDEVFGLYRDVFIEYEYEIPKSSFASSIIEPCAQED